MDMFRPGDAATLYRAVSASTRFQCVAHSELDAGKPRRQDGAPLAADIRHCR
jgi:hypothetical protein